MNDNFLFQSKEADAVSGIFNISAAILKFKA